MGGGTTNLEGTVNSTGASIRERIDNRSQRKAL
jgi:hypothetical protein